MFVHMEQSNRIKRNNKAAFENFQAIAYLRVLFRGCGGLASGLVALPFLLFFFSFAFIVAAVVQAARSYLWSPMSGGSLD
jgi:hypothetical protein